MTEPNPDTGVRRPRRQKPPRRPLLAMLFVLVLAGAAGGYYFLTRPHLVFTNQLRGAVRLSINSGEPIVVAPGKSVPLKSGGKTVSASWELMRPLSADRRPMGEEMVGASVTYEPKGTLHLRAAPRGTHGDYFAPLITNASDDLLRVKINAGLEGALDCGCAVRLGAKRAFIGYYRLYGNSTVQARTGDGREATFRDLGPSVMSPDGTIGLRFEGRDLRRE